jgi:transcription-repair coupling factor (superfamily II helicase)
LIALRGDRFANAARLVEPIERHAGTLKLRPDQKTVYLRDWEDEKTRLKGVVKLLQALVKIAGATNPEADALLPTPTSSLVRTSVARRA